VEGTGLKILSVSLRNFGSYKDLDFDFQGHGLTLIQGATGAGKSTFMDAIPWVLFGITSKGGKVDEIRAWATDAATTGTISLDTGTTICRTRSPNDLYMIDKDDNTVRGKDLQDTQRLIQNVLGVDADTYLSAAYFHEFSQTANFFTTTAKSRRETLEQIVDLSLALKLHTRLAEVNKTTKKNYDANLIEIDKANSNLAMLKQLATKENTKATDWDVQRQTSTLYIKRAYDRFEANRKHTVSGICTKCGTQLKDDIHMHNTEPNPHEEQLKMVTSAENPHKGSVQDFSQDITAKEAEKGALSSKEKELCSSLRDMELLKDTLVIFRNRLIEYTVSSIETQTNCLLEKHFDAEIQVNLKVESDKAEVSIFKNDNLASFTQLSKGQRQLLKLCFSCAVMKAAGNHSGISFPQLFFDEALSGLDENMKVKAFHLLEELALDYDSVFVIDHSEGFKTLFSNVYNVELVNGNSVICQS
jgi:DNA repair exonuclease SbcCD ATPase subunit